MVLAIIPMVLMTNNVYLLLVALHGRVVQSETPEHPALATGRAMGFAPDTDFASMLKFALQAIFWSVIFAGLYFQAA